ncbi:methylated-DNA--[protein]-cysteine S-methyltransferase [Anaerorhabdus furcosa]|uniref:Methylated-DNA--protein-cysteine methyltransferase n=1 Tax=Anaerorhabdus furcosa TaxID=118967 RepID=A0A1T4QA50_9FIRM|nr:methylated-DNA--[protein]-cysteine S-methyltransferase [Anaerorhabdus furcosa]SKA00619.1 methylated-DNA-[protein]-cysteine S-methyltransferase [Anaerorhabdus furcosa]
MKQRTIKTTVSRLNLVEENGALIELNFVDATVSYHDNTPLLLQAEKEILEYMNGSRKEFTIPLQVEGTSFQKDVWNAMLQIPYGEVRSYGEIAKMIQRPKSCRAVGNACNKNPIAILIPCHRVIASNHKLGGFGCGADNKIRLHEIENIKL